MFHFHEDKIVSSFGDLLLVLVLAFSSVYLSFPSPASNCYKYISAYSFLVEIGFIAKMFQKSKMESFTLDRGAGTRVE